MRCIFMKHNKFYWKGQVRKISGSYYIAIPPDYVKATEIEREDIVIFELRRNGLLMNFRKPVSPFEEKEMINNDRY